MTLHRHKEWHEVVQLQMARSQSPTNSIVSLSVPRSQKTVHLRYVAKEYIRGAADCHDRNWVGNDTSVQGAAGNHMVTFYSSGSHLLIIHAKEEEKACAVIGAIEAPERGSLTWSLKSVSPPVPYLSRASRKKNPLQNGAVISTYVSTYNTGCSA